MSCRVGNSDSADRRSRLKLSNSDGAIVSRHFFVIVCVRVTASAFRSLAETKSSAGTRGFVPSRGTVTAGLTTHREYCSFIEMRR
jgi:hypothetical protein